MPVLVATGCSSGLGHAALSLFCHRLLAHAQPAHPTTAGPWRILAGNRSASLTSDQEALTALCGHHPARVVLSWLPLDLDRSDSVRAFARAVQHHVRNTEQAIDVLLLNAAIWTADADRSLVAIEHQHWTREAVVNALSQHLLLDLLSPLLNASPSARPRIVITTSKLHESVASLEDLVAQLRPRDAQAAPMSSPSTSTALDTSPGTSATPSTGKSRYAASKCLQLVSAAYWAAKLFPRGVDVVAVSPGFVPTTNLSRAQSPLARWGLRYLVTWLPFAVPLEEGAARIARCLPVLPTRSEPPSDTHDSPTGDHHESSAADQQDSDAVPAYLLRHRTAVSRREEEVATSPARNPLVYLTGPSEAPLTTVDDPVAATGLLLGRGVAATLVDRASASAASPGGWDEVAREVLGLSEAGDGADTGWEAVARWDWGEKDPAGEGMAVGVR